MDIILFSVHIINLDKKDIHQLSLESLMDYFIALIVKKLIQCLMLFLIVYKKLPYLPEIFDRYHCLLRRLSPPLRMVYIYTVFYSLVYSLL